MGPDRWWVLGKESKMWEEACLRTRTQEEGSRMVEELRQ